MRWVRVATKVARHPSLWGTAARQVGALAPAGWWARPPFAPVPAADYLAFRLTTQYGPVERGHPPQPDPADVVRWLQWCRSLRSLS